MSSAVAASVAATVASLCRDFDPTAAPTARAKRRNSLKSQKDRLTFAGKWVPSVDDDVVSDRRRSAPGQCPVELCRALRYRVRPGDDPQAQDLWSTPLLPPLVIPGPSRAGGSRRCSGNLGFVGLD